MVDGKKGLGVGEGDFTLFEALFRGGTGGDGFGGKGVGGFVEEFLVPGVQVRDFGFGVGGRDGGEIEGEVFGEDRDLGFVCCCCCCCWSVSEARLR